MSWGEDVGRGEVHVKRETRASDKLRFRTRWTSLSHAPLEAEGTSVNLQLILLLIPSVNFLRTSTASFYPRLELSKEIALASSTTRSNYVIICACEANGGLSDTASALESAANTVACILETGLSISVVQIILPPSCLSYYYNLYYEMYV